MIDAVLSFHTDPMSCGVAKFSRLLAERLGVPHEQLASTHAREPIVSIKFQELIDAGVKHPFRRWDMTCREVLMADVAIPQTRWTAYDVFAHDVPDLWPTNLFIQGARTIYAANAEIAESLRAIYHREIVQAWCPSTLQGHTHRGQMNVLTFGMGHKLPRERERYRRLKALLDATGEDYTVNLSTAVHEGQPWYGQDAADDLRKIFGDRLRALGFLLDDALVLTLEDCSAVAMFFDPALRANNTTFWAAYDAGLPIVTNLDADSPIVEHGVFDIASLTTWPEGQPRRYLRSSRYSWDNLLRVIGVGGLA